MEDFSNILIVTDLDGTFFGEKAALVERNMKAIEYFKAGGGRFTIATGRMHCNMGKALPMAMELFNAPMICCNGALLYDMRTDTVLAERMIPAEIGLKLIDFIAENFGDVGARVSIPQGFMTSEDMLEAYPKLIRDLKTCDPDKFLVTPRENWDKYNWYKIVVRGDPARLDELRAAAEPLFSEYFDFSKSGATFFEAQSRGTTKAAMLDALRAHCEAQAGKRITMWCSGDYENDLTMLRKADVAVCPSNALDEVKAVCSYCLCHHTEGLMADIIELIIRQKGGNKTFA